MRIAFSANFHGSLPTYWLILAVYLAWVYARNASRLETQLAHAQLDALKMQLNPHFLFNTLNSVTVLTRKDPRLAEQALLQFAGMLRYVLSVKRDATERVPLEDEMQFVRDYLSLEAQRLGNRLQVDWDVDEATLADPVPPLTLQPLVENAIAHGVAPRVQGGRVSIRSARSGARTDVRSRFGGAGVLSSRTAVATKPIVMSTATPKNGPRQLIAPSSPPSSGPTEMPRPSAAS